MMGPGYEPLDKETALKHIKQIELRKVQQIAGALIATKMGKLPQNRMPMVQEMSKIQAIDSYNKESGIEDSDIVIAFNTLKLGETQEFKDIMGEANQTLQQTVQNTMMQMQQRMAQMGGMPGMGRGGMPGMGRGGMPGMGRGGMPAGMGRGGMGAPPQGPPPGQDTDAADLGW